MSAETLVSLLLAVGLAAYLTYALIRPDRF